MHLGKLRATAWTEHRVQVDAVRKTRVGRIVERQLDHLALANVDHWPGRGAVEGPVLVGDTVVHQGRHFARLEVNLDGC